MWSWTSERLKIWGVQAGLLALALQLLAGAVPMPSAAAGSAAAPIADGPAWIGDSVCRANGDTPAAADPVCPVCFVLCQAAGLPPPVPVPAAVPVVSRTASGLADDAVGPRTAPDPNPARGPPGLA